MTAPHDEDGNMVCHTFQGVRIPACWSAVVGRMCTCKPRVANKMEMESVRARIGRLEDELRNLKMELAAAAAKGCGE